MLERVPCVLLRGPGCLYYLSVVLDYLRTGYARHPWLCLLLSVTFVEGRSSARIICSIFSRCFLAVGQRQAPLSALLKQPRPSEGAELPPPNGVGGVWGWN